MKTTRPTIEFTDRTGCVLLVQRGNDRITMATDSDLGLSKEEALELCDTLKQFVEEME